MEIKDVRSFNDVWPYVQEQLVAAGFGRDLIHGLRHMRHVRKEAAILCEFCDEKLDASLVRCLKVAVDVHDLGRIKRTGNHAAVSADLFYQMPIQDLTPEEILAVCYAVQNHSHGLFGLGISRAENFQDKLLGLLCFCDHSDAASPDGAARAALALSDKPVLSNRFDVWHLRRLMAIGCRAEMMNVYKDDSLIAHLAFDYYATGRIFSPIRHLLSGRYIRERSNPRLAMYKAIINPLIQLQEMHKIFNH